MPSNNDVAKPSPEYERMLPIWRKVSDFVAGEAQVKSRDDHRGTTSPSISGRRILNSTYLTPFSPEMSPELYSLYLDYAQLPGVTSAMKDTVVGSIVATPYTLQADGYEELLQTISDDGLPVGSTVFNAVAADIDGRAGLFVDYPSVNELLTVAEREARDLQARISVFPARQIIETNYEVLNGIRQLVRVRLTMTEMVPDGEFGSMEQEVVLVLRLGNVFAEDGEAQFNGRLVYSQQRYVKTTVGEFVPLPLRVPLVNGDAIDFIPFWPTQATDEVPLLAPIADLEKHAYNTISSTNWSFARANTPTVVVTGAAQDAAEEATQQGWGGLWIFEQPEAKAIILSLPTDIISNYAAVIGQTRAMLAAQGANFLADSGRQVESAEALQIKNSGFFSKIEFRAVHQGIAIQEAIRFALLWSTGEDTSEVTFQLNPTFAPMQSYVDELKEVVNAYNSGVARKADVFNLLQKSGVIPQDVVFEDWMEELDELPAVSSGFPPAVTDEG